MLHFDKYLFVRSSYIKAIFLNMWCPNISITEKCTSQLQIPKVTDLEIFHSPHLHPVSDSVYGADTASEKGGRVKSGQHVCAIRGGLRNCPRGTHFHTERRSWIDF